MKHTKGPWIVNTEADITTADGANIIAFTSATVSDLRANAALIAAAPDMLEALQQAKTRLECAGLNDTTLDVIKAAINKARGDSA